MLLSNRLQNVQVLKRISLCIWDAIHSLPLSPYLREYLRLTLTAVKPERKNYASWQEQNYIEDLHEWETNPLFGWCNLIVTLRIGIYHDQLHYEDVLKQAAGFRK